MELNNIEKDKSVKIIHFNELKEMKFDEFEIYLGSEKTPNYLHKVEGEFYHKVIQKDDFGKYNLILKKRLNVNELLNYSDWNSIEELVENNNNTEEFNHEIYKVVRLYIQNYLFQQEQDIKLGDFQFTYIIDGVITKLKVSSKKKREIILSKFINYFFWIYIISMILGFFIEENFGLVLLFLPVLIYTIWVIFLGLKGVSKQLKYDRDGKNIFLYYLTELPFNIFIYAFYLTLVLVWFLLPFYFFYKSSFYYSLLEIIGGYIGEGVWIMLYFFLMTYLGGKIQKRIDKIERIIKSYF